VNNILLEHQFVWILVVADRLMAIAKDALIIGLTGSFGSGCSILAAALSPKGFKTISLSEPIHSEWKKQNKDKPPEAETRREDQEIGDILRKENGNAFLVDNAIKIHSAGTDKEQMLVFDSIRHPDEIAALRQLSHNCFIISVGSSPAERWRRLQSGYESKNKTIRDFQNDDERDANEDIPYGQKVQLCVDTADISIRNESNFDPKHKQKEEREKKTWPYIELVTGKYMRPPSPDESMMAVAYAKALSSLCYKRQVGAVIHDENGTVLGVGCNENPAPLGPCYDQYGECYRDLHKKRIFEGLVNTKCPKCDDILGANLLPPYRCTKCGFNLDKYYIRDKALSRCTALHAEESAIINVGGRNLKGCTMYTTTFPCFQCAQKIISGGIKKVVYCEPYPDPDGAALFNEVNQKYEKYGAPIIRIYTFEGVKARAYFRVFGHWRREMEKQIDEKRRTA
jgi:deoxycytidylate deaminase